MQIKEPSPVTVARPRRIHTGFPFKSQYIGTTFRLNPFLLAHKDPYSFQDLHQRLRGIVWRAGLAVNTRGVREIFALAGRRSIYDP